MAVILIVAESRALSYLTGPLNPPSYEQIRAALRGARLAGSDPARGDWIGAPRVTRTDSTSAGGLREWRTTVAALYGWPTGGPWAPGAPGPGLSEELRRTVAARLEDAPGSWEVRAVPYVAATHGSLSWWSSGDASHTLTRDEFPGVTGGLVDAPDNPTGPTTSATHPTTPGDAAGGAARAASGSLPWLTLGAVALAVGLVAWRFGGRQSVIVLDTGRGGARRVAA